MAPETEYTGFMSFGPELGCGRGKPFLYIGYPSSSGLPVGVVGCCSGCCGPVWTAIHWQWVVVVGAVVQWTAIH